MSLKMQLTQLKSTYAQSIVNKNINSIMNLYSEMALYKPAFSDIVRCSADEIRAYFLGSKEFQDPGFLNQGIVNIKFLGSEEVEHQDFIVSSGSYEFHFPDREIKIAEYTMTCCLETEQLKIIAQHSNSTRA